jgi:hypothetical protein
MTKSTTAAPGAVETDQETIHPHSVAPPNSSRSRTCSTSLTWPCPSCAGRFSPPIPTRCFLAKIGYRVEVVKQIHENDCYARLGTKGGIRAVLPLHDIATYSTMVTLVNYNASLTTTANSVDYYDRQLAEFKTQLMGKSGNAK